MKCRSSLSELSRIQVVTFGLISGKKQLVEVGVIRRKGMSSAAADGETSAISLPLAGEIGCSTAG